VETEITVKYKFVGFHRWPAAPEVVSFLRTQHRHIFVVRVGIRIPEDATDNRPLEFFMVQAAVRDAVMANTSAACPEGRDLATTSCEMFAKVLLEYLPAVLISMNREAKILWVSVSEDDENTSTAYAHRITPMCEQGGM
jgi:hypothetical protein